MNQEADRNGLLTSSWAIGGFVCISVMAILFAPQGPEWFGPKGSQLIISTFLAALGLWIVGDVNYAFRTVLGNALIFTIPLLGFMSTLWSIYPSVTLTAALQLLPTLLAALMLGTTRRRDAVLYGLFLAYIVYVAVSFAYGRTLVTGNKNGVVFTGLNYGKNFFGNTAAYGAMISIAVTSLGMARRNLIVLAAGAGGLAFCLYGLMLSKATGSIISLAIAGASFTFALGLGRIKPAARGFVLAAVVMVAIPILFQLEAIKDIATQFVFTTFHKTADLTGRTELWRDADALIAERPWLGRGYNAFWTQGSLDAETLWARNLIFTRTGFNFHNQAREILIGLGWSGLVLITLSIFPKLLALIRRILEKATIFDAFMFALVTYTLVRMPVESVLPSPFSMDTLLFFAALAGPAMKLVRQWNEAPNARGRQAYLYRSVVTARPTFAKSGPTSLGQASRPFRTREVK